MTKGSKSISSRLTTWRLSAAMILSFSLTLSAFSSARATDASRSQTQMLRAQALQNIANGRDQDAIENYKDAIKEARAQYGQESTYLSDLYFEMGSLARNKGQSELAQSCYRNAVKYRPNDVPARVQLAELERNTKNIPGAFEDSKIAYAKNPALAISRKELMMCLQLSGRPAEAAKIGATLSRTSKNVPAMPKNIPTPKVQSSEPEVETPPPSNGNGPVVTSASAGNSALHWQRKKTEDEAGKHAKEHQAAEDAKRKAEEAAKKEKQAQEQKQQEQRKKEEAEKKSKQKQKKDEAKKSSKSKPAATTSASSEQHAATGSLSTSATTLPKSDDKSKADKSDKGDKSDKSDKADKSDKTDKSDKAEKPASKTHASVSAVTEKSEKPAAEKHESSLSENEPAKPKNLPPAEKPQQPVAMPNVPMMIPVETGKKGSKSPHNARPGVLVPPPPATPLFYPPPPMQAAPPPAAVAPKKPKPKPAVKETPKDTDEAASSKSSSADEQDPDFLIHWGDAGKKKHASPK